MEPFATSLKSTGSLLQLAFAWVIKTAATIDFNYFLGLLIAIKATTTIKVLKPAMLMWWIGQADSAIAFIVEEASFGIINFIAP